MKRALEPDIKSSLINKLRATNSLGEDDFIVNEFNVGDCSRRADLLIVKKDTLHAFEIKSASDSLIRLSDQVYKYLQYFDKVTVVSAKKHSKKVLELTPDNVAVWEVNERKIKTLRRGKKRIIKNKKNLIELMTVSDMRTALTELKIKHSNIKRNGLEEIILNLPIKSIRESLTRSLKRRFKDTNRAFFNATFNRPSTPEDLKLLRPNPRDLIEDKLHISRFLEAIKHIKQ